MPMLGYVLRETRASLTRNLILTSGTVVMTALAVFVLGVALIFDGLMTGLSETLDTPQAAMVIREAADYAEVVRTIGAVVTILFLASALALMHSMTWLSIWVRRDEVKIMRLIGASSWFIRTPFVLAGAATGLLGAGLAILPFVGARLLLLPVSAPLSWLLGLGVCVGAAGALVALRRL